jgi:pimeloyl-ACP methyl ester carboxylesterase
VPVERAPLREEWSEVDGRPVHAYVADPPADPFADPSAEPRPAGGVVLLPGLGLPDYTFPTARALAARGVPCTVLDLPGFGTHRPDACRSHIHDVGRLAAAWVLAQPAEAVTVVMGHSTGSQAALTAVLGLQQARAGLHLVLAGPTFQPGQRRVLPLALAAVTAYRRDTLRELVIAPAAARGRTGVWRVLRSGMRDRPEERVRRVTVPVTLTAGEDDSFAPRWWLDRLAQAAGAAPEVHRAVLSGSHNNLFTHPQQVAEVVAAAARGRRLPPEHEG